MVLKEKETEALKDLQTQEASCIEKYTRYEKMAKDTELKSLFRTLSQKEQQHYDTLGQMMTGTAPACDCNDEAGMNYQPKATYAEGGNAEDKATDDFLVTDCIGSEKLVSGEYNTNIFNFSDASMRKALADIQIEEQNHAEMLYKYKTVNKMS